LKPACARAIGRRGSEELLTPRPLPPAGPALSVIVPFCDEACRVEATTGAVLRELDAAGPLEVLLVDDGSRDGTGDVASRLARADPRVKALSWPANRGKGYALRQAIPLTRGDLVLYTDADLSTDLACYRDLRAAVARGADVAFGSRAAPGAEILVQPPALRELLGRTGNLILRIVDPRLRPFVDTQCGFKLARGDVLRAITPVLTVDRWGFDFELLHVAVARGYRVEEVAVRWSDARPSRVGRLDHVKTLGDLARVLWNEARGSYRQ
jgi:glycosyltransferase involved in cell wall biosynthesis